MNVIWALVAVAVMTVPLILFAFGDAPAAPRTGPPTIPPRARRGLWAGDHPADSRSAHPADYGVDDLLREEIVLQDPTEAFIIETDRILNELERSQEIQETS